MWQQSKKKMAIKSGSGEENNRENEIESEEMAWHLNNGGSVTTA